MPAVDPVTSGIYFSLASPEAGVSDADGGSGVTIAYHGSVPSEWIDVSMPVRAGMVHWPGDPAFKIERFLDLDRGDVCTVSRVTLGTHTGTHIDAPLHFLQNAPSIDTAPLDATIGEARVIEIADEESVKPSELERHHIREGERVLFKTVNSARCVKADAFIEDFVYISHEAAKFLAARKIRTVGIDYLSVGGYAKEGPETHRTLLAAGIWVIEGLDLSAASAGECELVCLPMKLMGAEGAPARAAIRKGNTR